MKRSTQFNMILTQRVNKPKVRLGRSEQGTTVRDRDTTVMRLEHKEAGDTGAADEAVRSSNTHSRRPGHNYLLNFGSPQVDVTLQVVCHSSAHMPRGNQ